MLRLAFAVLFSAALFADEASTAARLEALRQDPPMLRRFLEQMPKGGDLHNHLSGTVYAETFIRLAAADGLCIDTQRAGIVVCDAGKDYVPAADALKDPALYTRLTDALSMRQFDGAGKAGSESGHDHFFGAFSRMGPVSRAHIPEMLTEVVSRFASENVDYVETLFSQDKGASRELGRALKPGSSFEEMRAALLQGGAADVVRQSRRTLDDAESRMRTDLRCASETPQPGCASTVRYLFETHRAFAREVLFAELVVGFELASADPRVVGVNVVQPEDSYASMASFDELMRMFAFLRPLYPAVRVSAHAGELAGGLVPPEGMRNHVRDSVLVAKAERIGHGVDIAYETEALALMRTMAQTAVAVEVCLTSNDVILGVKGKRHPLRMYLRNGVPVVLATDDAGVSRIDMTHEWQRAVEEHGLTYRELKRIARNSIEYSFLEGESLWTDASFRKMHSACARETSDACQRFLASSAKAREQWKLERRLKAFEASELR